MDTETLARELCDERWGEGTYDRGKINRTFWRRKAKLQLAEDVKQLYLDTVVPDRHNYLLED